MGHVCSTCLLPFAARDTPIVPRAAPEASCMMSWRMLASVNRSANSCCSCSLRPRVTVHLAPCLEVFHSRNLTSGWLSALSRLHAQPAKPWPSIATQHGPRSGTTVGAQLAAHHIRTNNHPTGDLATGSAFHNASTPAPARHCSQVDCSFDE